MDALGKTHTLKPVQEILKSGRMPESYIQPKDEYEVDDDLLPMIDDLTIDFSLLSSSANELTKLRSTLSSWGCAQIVNHGMSSSLLDELRDISKQFFQLPQVEKDRYSSKTSSLEGYGNDNVIREGSFNWNDKLHLQVYPFHKRQLYFWPEKPHNFRYSIIIFCDFLACIYNSNITVLLHTILVFFLLASFELIYIKVF